MILIATQKRVTGIESKKVHFVATGTRGRFSLLASSGLRIIKAVSIKVDVNTPPKKPIKP